MATNRIQSYPTRKAAKGAVPPMPGAALGIYHQADLAAASPNVPGSMFVPPLSTIAYGMGTLVLVRTVVTLAQLNAGIDLMPAVADMQYRVVDFTATAVGGAAAGATSVEIEGTQSASTVDLFSIAVAALTQNTSVKPNSANVTPLAGAAWNVRNDANTPLRLTATGTATTLTSIVVLLTLEISSN